MPSPVPGAPAPEIIGRLPELRNILAEGRAEIRAAYERKPEPARCLRSTARLVDRVLREIWKTVGMPGSAALVAVGGYGRGGLFPHSDVDVLILLPAAPGPAQEEQLEQLIQALWDVGLEIGHSVRTVAECVEESRRDLTVHTNLLEARLLAGSRALFRRFSEQMVAITDGAAFLQSKQLEQEQRHRRLEDAASRLEPNIKESPGGLRDLQTLIWVGRAAALGSDWRSLAASGLLGPEEERMLRRCERFLCDLRVRLHYLAGRREDRLLFDFQTALALQYDLSDRGVRRASELLMQRYYRSAKLVAQLNLIALLNFEARLSPPEPEPPLNLNERFRVVGNLLEMRDPEVFERQPGAILESFLLLQQHPELKGREPRTLRALWRATRRIGAEFRRDPENRNLFMEILRQPRGITHELRRMNRYGVLGRYIPAFGRIVGQMQHDLYHVYTVDEHILMVVRNLRRFALTEFAHEYPLCSRLMSEFDRPEVLYLAALFHDIAKGRGGDHSALGASDARRFCRAHGLIPEDADLVTWLVQQHLVMSATAQKQDLSDPQTVASFAELVRDDRRLVALYLLTVADIRGTSPKVWNSWKGKLLEDLFWLARRHLRGAGPAPARALEVRQQEALAQLQLQLVPEGAHRKFWSTLDTVYFLRHDAQEIAWHTRILNYRVDAAEPVVKARLAGLEDGLQVMIYCSDRRELFARICDAFARMGFSVVEAKIYTTRHGYALDTFQVLLPEEKPENYRDLMNFVEYELAAALGSEAPLGPPPSGRVSRQLKHFPMAPEVSMRADDRGQYRVLSIVAGDRTGLLSRIARVLVARNVAVHGARISTLGERAEDTFLITGPRLDDDRVAVALETDLVAALKS